MRKVRVKLLRVEARMSYHEAKKRRVKLEFPCWFRYVKGQYNRG